MKIKVLTPFRFAEDGITVTAYGKGEHRVSKRVADVAIARGWARKIRAGWLRFGKAEK